MGNACVGPSVGGNGFFQSITSAFKKSPPPEARLPAPDANKDNTSTENAGPADSSKDSDATKQVHSTPPELVKIPSDELPPPPPPAAAAEPEKPAKPDDVNEPTPSTSGAGKDEKPAKTEVVNDPAPNNTAAARGPEKPVKPEVVKEPAPNNTAAAGEHGKPVKSEVVKDPAPNNTAAAGEPEKPVKPEVVNDPAPDNTAAAGVPEKPVKPEVVNDDPAPNNTFDVREPEKPVKPEVVNEASSSNTANAGEATKPAHVKRVSSMGLKIDSVLGKKNENIKDFYSLGRKLGQGQFGTTYYCLEKTTGKEFACKSILKRKLNSKEDVDDVRREIQIMHHLSGHPNVIQIIGAYEDAVAVHVVMELCSGGELFDRIIQRGHYTEKKAAELARVIVGVVEAFHSMGVMHRDLKPENFLFVGQEEESQLKTIDFGLSVFFRPGEIFTDVVGSPYYVAPEVLRKYYGKECDVWSAGVIIYILLSGVPPFWDETELGIFDQVLKGELDLVSEPWPSISASAKDLLRKMLVRDPKKRLSAREVLCHPWFETEGFALDKPLDSVVLTRLKRYSARNNKLRKMAIRVIAESLSEDEIAGLKEMFKMIDSDNSGHITREELKVGLEKVGAALKDSEIDRLMQSADTDNSGTLDYSEFITAMLHENKVQREDRLFTAFSFFDKDNSGYITRDELQQACQKFGLQDVQLDDIIREVDRDNDGRIDYNEFVAMMQDTGGLFNSGNRVADVVEN